MTPVTNAPDFEQALGDLQDHLPSWWQTQDPSSELYKLLSAIAQSIDALSALWEAPYLDQVITTATADGLQRNFAYAWGLTQEQLPSVLSQLVAYIQARTAEDGSVLSLINTLTTLVDTPVNTTGGPLLTFPGFLTFDPGGAGIALPNYFPPAGLTFPDPAGSNLVFPMSGGVTLPATFGGQPAGLSLYEFTPGNGPSTAIGLYFPRDGSGLVFPEFPTSVPSDNVIISDGTIPIGAGPGLVFSENQFVNVIQDFTNSILTVQVQNWLTFDRAAFRRAVQRFQTPDWFPSVIREITSYH